MACWMCMGTDCADACSHGYCYAEEMFFLALLQERREEEWMEQQYAESCEAAQAIGQFARRFGEAA